MYYDKLLPNKNQPKQNWPQLNWPPMNCPADETALPTKITPLADEISKQHSTIDSSSVQYSANQYRTRRLLV